MQRTTHYGICADLRRSHGAYVYDLVTDRLVLDGFGQYSSLPLGYGHPVFRTTAFLEEAEPHIGVKLALCEMTTPSVRKAVLDILDASPGFDRVHFTTTGSSAVEAAVKAAIDQRGFGPSSRVVTFQSNFHGIYGYGGALTSAAGPAMSRVAGFPNSQIALMLPDPRDGAESSNVLAQLEHKLSIGFPIAAVLVEPIQCTAGDRQLSAGVLRQIRRICDDHMVPLIFDEVQTGFGATGAMWYAQHVGVLPDIIVFGKRAQVSGILARQWIGQIFDRPERLEATWDGNALDLIRCRTILKTYWRENILTNVQRMGSLFLQSLQEQGLSARGVGLLIAIDFSGREERDRFQQRLWQDQAMTVIRTGERTVRVRFPLTLDEETCWQAVQRIRCAAES